MKKPNSILYVEDDMMSRRIMQMLLERNMGIKHVTMFEDSNEFLLKAEAITPQPDIIFLDIHLGPLDGFEMLQLIKSSNVLNHIPVIAMTASVMNNEVKLLEQSGFDGCIAKPINKDIFPELLHKIMNKGSVWRI